MATSDDEDDEEKRVEKEISELKSAKTELFEKASPINEELERITRRERECVERLDCLKTERHERTQHQQILQRLVDLHSELQHVKCDNAKLSDTNRKLKQSLDQATKYSKIQKRKIAELEGMVTVAEQALHLSTSVALERSDIIDSNDVTKLQKQLTRTCKLLKKTKEGLSEARQRLCEVQERLTVAEQVTAATQQRAVLESDNSQKLLLELTSQRPATCRGLVMMF